MDGLIPKHQLKLLAPAKVNLGLQVLHKRPDGFHEIRTVMAKVDVFDTIHLTGAHDGEIRLDLESGFAIPSNGANLCTMAARKLRDAIGDQSLGIGIRLQKQIPVGAGLGGGSSDAASVLLGARTLWNAKDITDDDLRTIGAAIGSDVPFFLHDYPIALASGRGEILAPVPIHLSVHLLLVNPGVHVSTAWAYAELSRGNASIETPHNAVDALTELHNGHIEIARELLHNDFEDVVLSAHPAIRMIKSKLYTDGAQLALMSGSGSTMVGVFATREQADASALNFENFWTRVCTVVE